MSLDILIKGQLSFLNKDFEVIAVSGQDDYLKNVATREGVRTEDVPMSRAIEPIKDLVSLIKLYRLFKKEKPLIVHSITPKAGLLSMTAAYFARVPIRIHTFTGLIFPYKSGILKLILLTLDKVTCKFATHIFPEGEGVKKDLIRYKVTSKELRILANGNVNGIDTEYFNPQLFSDTEKQQLKTTLDLKNADFVYVYVGRLVADKGINELILAFTTISSQFQNCKLVLVGPYESDLDPLLPKTLQHIESNSAIICTGFQNDIRPYLAISDVFVFPSHREGFPNVLLQAGAMKLPCIVTDISGSNEIISEGYNGIIVNVNDAKMLVEKMLLVYNDVNLLNQLRLKTRENILNKYQQELVWNAILAEYKKAERNV